jgi:hypothetical protein
MGCVVDGLRVLALNLAKKIAGEPHDPGSICELDRSLRRIIREQVCGTRYEIYVVNLLACRIVDLKAELCGSQEKMSFVLGLGPGKWTHVTRILSTLGGNRTARTVVDGETLSSKTVRLLLLASLKLANLEVFSYTGTYRLRHKDRSECIRDKTSEIIACYTDCLDIISKCSRRLSKPQSK